MRKIFLLLSLFTFLSANAMDKARLKVGPVKTKVKAVDVKASFSDGTDVYRVSIEGSAKKGKRRNSLTVIFPQGVTSFEKGDSFEVYHDLGDPADESPEKALFFNSLRVEGKEVDTLYSPALGETSTTGKVKVKSFNPKTRVLKLNIKTSTVKFRVLEFEPGTQNILNDEVKEEAVVTKAQIVVTLPEPVAQEEDD